MEKMPHNEREADVTAVISTGSRLCALQTDYLAAPDAEELRAEPPRSRGRQPPADWVTTERFEGQRHWRFYNPSNPPHACGRLWIFCPSGRLTFPSDNPPPLD
jgi:hypothetical protein